MPMAGFSMQELGTVRTDTELKTVHARAVPIENTDMAMAGFSMQEIGTVRTDTEL